MVHSVNKKFRQKAWFSAFSDICMCRVCLILHGIARFRNFEYDNTTAGEDLHCIYSEEYLRENVLLKYPSISPEIIRMRDN